MSPQNRIIISNVSSVLVLIGAVLAYIDWVYAPYLFAFGAAGFTLMALLTPHKHLGIRSKRLHRFTMYAGVLMIAASSLMFMNRKEWVVLVLIAAVLLVYTSFVKVKEEE